MLRNALLNPVKDMTTNFHKLMVLSNYINVLCCFGFANILIFYYTLYAKTKKIYRNALRYILIIFA
jgi:hypothetical protein